MLLVLFVLIHRPRFIPSSLDQAYRILFLGILIIYVINHGNKLKFNDPLTWLYGSIFISNIYNYVFRSFSRKAIFNSMFFLVNLYVIFQLIQIVCERKKKDKILKTLFWINSFYCIFALLFIDKKLYITVPGTESYMYALGNKFDTSYLFISLTCMFGMCYLQKKRNKINVLMFVGLIFLSAYVSNHLDCQTAAVASFIPGIVFLINSLHRKVLRNRFFAIGVVFITASFPIIAEAIVRNKFVQYFLNTVLHRDLTLSSRMNVYTKYLFVVIKRRVFLGYGYGNSAMFRISNYYRNAQNGLWNYFVMFGLVGVAILIYFIKCIFTMVDEKEGIIGPIMLFYSMVFAGTVEVTYNWHFYISLALLYYYNYENRNNRECTATQNTDIIIDTEKSPNNII